jgi:hypothetical protein
LKPWYITQSKWDKEQDHVAIRLQIANNAKTVVLGYLYERLNVLDAKVAALLTFNSILLAAASLVWAKIVELPGAKPLFLYVAALAWLVSTFTCLSISFLKWEHLRNSGSSYDHYRDKIIKVTIRRTCAYNFAVGLIFLVLIVFVSMWV